MQVDEILKEIDHEIEKLRQARKVLAVATSPTETKPGPKIATVKTKKRRRLSVEGRKQISEAAKRRWASQKKVSAAK